MTVDVRKRRKFGCWRSGRSFYFLKEGQCNSHLKNVYGRHDAVADVMKLKW